MRSSIGHDLTAHAQARMKQRGIRPEAVACLLDFGRESFDHRGGVVLYLDKAARRRLQRAQPGRKDLERLAGMYAVLSTDGAVITVGHRRRRVRR
jgi:hypothetical protein